MVSPRVDDELTPLGAQLPDTVEPPVRFAEDDQATIATARAAYDVREAAERATTERDAALREPGPVRA